MEKRYTVRETVELTGVKSHVLRYWEEELNLVIHRNELGHRYYTENDIQVFQNIKELKAKGLQLRAIKERIPNLQDNMETKGTQFIFVENIEKETNATDSEKILEFQQILEKLIKQEIKLKSKEEVHYRTIDAAIRKQQQIRREAAVTLESGKK